MKHKILLGLTGSVATVLYEKLIKELQTIGDVDVILTESAKHFVDRLELAKVLDKPNCIFDDESEWLWKHPDSDGNGSWCYSSNWKKNDPVLHIKLRDEYSALVIAPCSANTLAKLANGLCDNLLTTVARAWDLNRPFIIAPAMNTHMWNHPITEEHLCVFLRFSKNNRLFRPQKKMLACGTEGIGAMGEIGGIVEMTKQHLRWQFPLAPEICSGIPMTGHPGSFSCQRKHEKHTGVDLYTVDGALVHAVEAGTVVGKEHFTGEWDKSPWWNNTECLLVEGATGVICYGEILVPFYISVGSRVEKGQFIGNVKRVLKEGKERPDIEGHSTSMLHMELYPHGTVKASDGFDGELLNDPTPFLLESYGRPEKILKYESRNSNSNLKV